MAPIVPPQAGHNNQSLNVDLDADDDDLEMILSSSISRPSLADIRGLDGTDDFDILGGYSGRIKRSKRDSDRDIGYRIPSPRMCMSFVYLIPSQAV